MKEVTVHIEEYLYDFYKKLGQSVGNIPPEKMMAKVLFQLAGEASVTAISKKTK